MRRKYLPHVAGGVAAAGTAAGHALHLGPYVLHFLDYLVGYHVLQEILSTLVQAAVPVPYVLGLSLLAGATVMLYRKFAKGEHE